jgi:hypothetical protein
MRLEVSLHRLREQEPPQVYVHLLEKRMAKLGQDLIQRTN